MRRVATSWSVLLVLGLVSGCGDDVVVDSPPADSSSSNSSASDASPGSDSESSDTKDPVDSSGDTGSDETSSEPADQTSATSAPPADSTSSEPVVSGDAGPSTDDTGAAECSPGSAFGVEDECATLAEQNWCESFDADLSCSMTAMSKDEAIYDTLIACLNHVFSQEGACDLSEDDMVAQVYECEALADASACPVEVEACAVYADCDDYTVEQCNAVAAKYHDDWVAMSEFGCDLHPAEALGEVLPE
jgi:hypothetical protein